MHTSVNKWVLPSVSAVLALQELQKQRKGKSNYTSTTTEFFPQIAVADLPNTQFLL